VAVTGCPWHFGPMAWYHGIVPSLLCGEHPVLLGKEKQMVQESANLLTVELTGNAPNSVYATARRKAFYKWLPKMGTTASVAFKH